MNQPAEGAVSIEREVQLGFVGKTGSSRAWTRADVGG